MKLGKIKLVVFMLYITLMLSTNIYAQNKTDDCIIYKNVLLYLNEKEADVKYTYEGTIDPEVDDIGKLVEGDGLQQYYFYIVDKKSEFGYLSVRDWFSKLLKDSTVIQKNYIFNKDSIINCVFDDGIKYQYKPFIEIEFSEKNYLQEKKEGMNVHYTPIRTTFSKVLYTQDDRALVFAKIYQGIGRGRDSYVYGFVFKKNKIYWELSLVEVEIR